MILSTVIIRLAELSDIDTTIKLMTLSRDTYHILIPIFNHKNLTRCKQRYISSVPSFGQLYKLVNKTDYLIIDNIGKICYADIVTVDGQYIPYKTLSLNLNSPTYDRYNYPHFRQIVPLSQIISHKYKCTYSYRLSNVSMRMDYISVVGLDAGKLIKFTLVIDNQDTLIRYPPFDNGKIIMFPNITDPIPLLQHNIQLNCQFSDHPSDVGFVINEPISTTNVIYHNNNKDYLTYHWLYLTDLGDIGSLVIFNGGASVRVIDSYWPSNVNLSQIYFHDITIPNQALTIDELIDWVNQHAIIIPLSILTQQTSKLVNAHIII